MKHPPPVIPPALDAMREFEQWICWDLIQKPGKPKPDKVPTDPRTRFPVSIKNPFHWMNAEAAMAAATTAQLGIGFVFTERDPFGFLDIDNCATPLGPRPWADHAYQLTSLLQGAAVETSCSGRGLHVFGRCAQDLVLHRKKKNPELHIELYTSERFVALGTRAKGDAGKDCTAGFAALAAHYFPLTTNLTGVWTTEAQPGSGIADDDALIRKARNATGSAASRFGDKASFEQLWTADVEALAVAFPGGIHRVYDASSADMALAAHLTFWTGGNCEQVQRIMRQSALVRGKWEREDYLPNTISKAVGLSDDVYRGPVDSTPDIPVPSPPPSEVPASPANTPPPPSDEVTVIDGYPYVPPEAVLQMFRDHVYVLSSNKVVTPKGELIDESRFKNYYGHYDFATDHNGAHSTNAWKAFIYSKCWTFRRADRVCFKPMSYDLTIKEGNDTLANIWRDPNPKRVKGDPTQILDHIAWMFPDGDDAVRLWAYMAACVQHQGTKFAWCPILQGVQGNGKSMLAEILAHAIGEKYVHVLSGASLMKKDSNFNAYMATNTLVIVEEIMIKGDLTVLEKLKPMITGRRTQVEPKGVDATTQDICCNFWMTTNHQDAIPLDRNERRWAMFFCAQQTEADLGGLPANYFVSLYDWLKNAEGFAILAEHLWTYAIPNEMNPAADCVTAPKTTTHERAIEASLSTDAQFIRDAIQDERPGFKGGWASSTAARSLLRENQIRTAPQKISFILAGLGFVRHPGLEGGKTPRDVANEGGRPRLWIREKHSSCLFRGAAVVDAYETAQGYDAVRVVPMR